MTPTILRVLLVLVALLNAGWVASIKAIEQLARSENDSNSTRKPGNVAISG
jgi:hypothetical protein